jgi:hypothetical protein
MKGKLILMKKILAAVLAISMMFAIAACDSTPAESESTERERTTTQKTEKETEATTKATTTAATTVATTEATDEPDIMDMTINMGEIPSTGSEAMDSFIAMVADGEFGFDFEMTGEESGTVMTATGSFAVKGEKIDLVMGMAAEGITMDMHFLIADGYSYMISDDSKSYIQMGEEIGLEMSPLSDSDFSNIVLIDSGEAELNGEMLTYEEYDQDGDTIRFYVKDGEIYAFEAPDGEDAALIIFTDIYGEVDDDRFVIPADYTEM